MKFLLCRPRGLSRGGWTTAEDAEKKKNRILITRDKGFGQLVFVSKQRHCGVILLRIDPARVGAVHQELERFLTEHQDEDMSGRLVVIEPARHRIRSPG